jgi:hypothetical protein
MLALIAPNEKKPEEYTESTNMQRETGANLDLP